MNTLRSDFLFAIPSFVSGAARALDLYGTFDTYPASSSEREADSDALHSDWRMVGQDILGAMMEFASSPPVSDSIAHHNERATDDRQMSFFR